MYDNRIPRVFRVNKYGSRYRNPWGGLRSDSMNGNSFNGTSLGAETRFRLSEKGLVQEEGSDIPKYIFGGLIGAGLLWLASNLTFKRKTKNKLKGMF